MSADTKKLKDVKLNADTLDGKHDGELTSKNLSASDIKTVGVPVAEAKANVLDAVKGGVFGNIAKVGNGLIMNWNNDNVTTPSSSAWSMINVTPQYDGDRYGQYMLFHYGPSNPKLIGRSDFGWTEIRTFAFLEDNMASSQKLQDSSGVYLDRATWNALVARVAALENK